MRLRKSSRRIFLEMKLLENRKKWSYKIKISRLIRMRP